MIEFGSTDMDGETVFFVRDNGAGFDPMYADRLFQPFQRLHPRSPASSGGHGLGLSIVRAIAAVHGAAIAAQARPGGGLSVDVTFPPVAGQAAETRLRSMVPD